MPSIAEKKAARARALAELAVQIGVRSTHPNDNHVKEAIAMAEDLLVAAEDLVAAKYGEFR